MRLASRTRRFFVLPRLTMPSLWALSALATIFVSCGFTGIALGDFWWHLRVGEVIATTHGIPSVDDFSFIAAGRPYVYQQWLGEIYLYALHAVGGLPLVVFANTLVVTATAFVTLWAAQLVSQNLRVAALCALTGILIAMPNRDVRPQTLGFLFFAVCYLVLLRYRRGQSGPLWLLPVLVALWANIHGSVLLGFALAALVLVAEVVKSRLAFWPVVLPPRRLLALGLAVAAMPLAMLLNPSGPGIFRYFITIQSSPVIQNAVTEWAAPSLRNPSHLPFFGAFFLAVALLAISGRRCDLTDVVLFVAFGALALEAVRSSPWFGIVAAPIVAAHLPWGRSDKGNGGLETGSVAQRGERDVPGGGAEQLANWLFAGIILALALASLPWVKQGLPLPPAQRGLVDAETPVAAVRFVAEHFPLERIFHTETYGGYMIWAAKDGPKVFVDGRIELYPVEVWDDYIQTSLARNWEEGLAKYRLDHLLLPKRPFKDFQRPLLGALARSPNWERVYEDEQAIVYVRRR